MTGFFDPRIDFICLDYPNCLEYIDSFTGNTDQELDEELENFTSNVIESSVNVNFDQNEITLPKILQVYSVDFESNESTILQFVFRYIEGDNDIMEILEQVKNKQILLKYE